MPSETTLCPKCGNAMRPVLDRKGGFTCTSLRCTGYGVRQPVSAAPRREPTPGTTQREEWVVQEQSKRPCDPQDWTDWHTTNVREIAEDSLARQKARHSDTIRFRLVHRAITERVVSDPTSTVIEGASE